MTRRALFVCRHNRSATQRVVKAHNAMRHVGLRNARMSIDRRPRTASLSGEDIR